MKFKNSNVNANISITAEKFLKQKSFLKDFKIKKDGLIDWIKSVFVGESKLCQRLAAKFDAEKQWI